MQFKDKIKARRLMLDKTLEEVGAAVGVSKTTVQRWESGVIKGVAHDKIKLLAKALDCDVNYLIDISTDENADLDISSVEYAIYGEARNLDEDEKKQLLELARLMRRKREEQRKE